jgi:hypothetical protein
MKVMWKNGGGRTGEDIIAIAVSGVDSKRRKCTTYGIFNSQSPDYKLLSGVGILSFSEAMERLYAFDNLQDVKSIKYQNVTNFFISTSRFRSLVIEKAEFQREIDKVHYIDIYNSLIEDYKNNKENKAIGSLIIAPYYNKYCLIDGQHRLSAYTDLLNILKIDLCISVQFIMESNPNEVKRLFIIHNKAKEATDEEKIGKSMTWYDKHAKDVLEMIGSRYKRASGVSVVTRNAKAPSINYDKIRSELSQYFRDNPSYKTVSAEDIFAQIVKRNEYLVSNPNKINKYISGEYKSSTIKYADDMKCWLGLMTPKSWFQE